MTEQKTVNLYEAYASIYAPQEEVEQLDEASPRISRSMGRRATQYRRDQEQAAHMASVAAHQEKMKNDPEYARKHEEARTVHQRAHERSEARKNKAGETQKESYDLFDTILEHLVSEGYADTNEAALVIMANMSEEWRQSIVEGGFNSSGRYDVGGGRTVGPVAGAVRSLFSGNLPKGQTYVPPTKQTGPNRPPAVPASKDDSGKLTDFGAGGGKAKLKTGMSVGQVERQGRMNKGDYSG